MFYQQFLSALVQLASSGRALLPLEQGELHLCLLEGSFCRVKMHLHSFDGEVSPTHLGIVKSLTWHPGSPRIEVDASTGSISLIGHLLVQQGEYLSFKEEIRSFLSFASEWQEIVRQPCFV